jgi:hypothetical protein
MTVYTVMNNSTSILLGQFDQVNDHYKVNAIIVAEAVKQTNFSK